MKGKRILACVLAGVMLRSAVVPVAATEMPQEEPVQEMTESETEVPAAVDAADEEAVYTGIRIDGVFDDWDAVTKYDPIDSNPGWQNLESLAMVFDGDYVYLYIKEQMYGQACSAGYSANGKYEITTDLGYSLMFQLTGQGTISGVDNAEVCCADKQWEISIPVSELPAYQSAISFGLSLDEPTIKDVVNLDGSDSGGSFTGVVYDGLYGDWTYYPHTTLRYDQSMRAEGALYVSEDLLYGHVVSSMTVHSQSAGGEMTSGIAVNFGGNDYFYPRLVTVDAAGNIDWDPQRSGLANGTYEFWLADANAGHASTNVNEMAEGERMYGKFTLTVSDTKDECEFYLELEALAERMGCDTGDFKEYRAQFVNIGGQWIIVAGSSTGAAAGVFFCCAVTAGVLACKKRRRAWEVASA